MPEQKGGANREAQAIADADLIRSQREANEHLVISALRAHEETEAAEAVVLDLQSMAELRERLMGILGHDLRNPLSAIMMGVGLLVARGNLTEEDMRLAVRILNSGGRMTRMITQLLDFTRIRLGEGMVLDRRPMNLGKMCWDIAGEFELGAPIPVQCAMNGDLTGSWDIDRLSEVLSNIVGNAIEHASAGTSVRLHLSTDGTHVTVEISNEGPAIPPDVLPFIFEPFRRARQLETSKTGNLGLGLYIAREIAQAHGGTLDVRSTKGRTTFTMRLPRAVEPL